MEEAAKLWKEYLPKLAEAKEADRQDVQMSLVAAPSLVGKWWVSPMTLTAFLFLESIKHPYLTGELATREDALNFLWIMSPEFRPGDPKASKKFFRRFWFRKVDQELLRDYLAKEFESDAQENSKTPEAAWVARMVDMLASEYGWSERSIFEIPLKRLFRYSEAMVHRRSDKSVAMNTPKADKVRNEYMRAMGKIQKRKSEETVKA